MNKVTIRGCFSVLGKAGWEIKKDWDTTGISVEKSGDWLVMKGHEGLKTPVIQVGNQLEIDLERNVYDKDNSFWLERTNKPYTNGMEVNEWMNMIRENSHVFDKIAQSPEEAVSYAEETDRRIGEAKSEEQVRSIEKEAGTMIIDPPTVTMGESRKLEFIIYLRGEGSQKNFLMLAEQNIEFDSANKQNFRIGFVVYKCGFLSTPSAESGEEEGNWDEELKSKLDGYVTGYDGRQESAMNDFREYVDQIPEEAFKEIQVDYAVSELCEFNSWDEEP